MLLHNLRYIKRVREILTVFFEEGFGYLIKQAHLHQYVIFSRKMRAVLREEETLWKPEVSLRHALERLGPTFVKLGQILSLRPDILPSSYIAELDAMQDKVPAVPFSHIKMIITSELGCDIPTVFSEFGQRPIASASLAQVYKARLKTGQQVAVKVLRPGIEKIIAEDCEILLFLAHWIDRKHLLHISLTPLVEEFRRWTLCEINLHYEAAQLALFRENFKNQRSIIIPRVYESASRQRVLTLDFIRGIPLHDIQRLPKQRVRGLLRTTYQAIAEMVFIHGLFHADPHPGNILTVGNKIAFIDFGIVGKLDGTLRRTSLRLFQAMLEGDARAAGDALLELSTHSVNERELRRDLDDLIAQSRLDDLACVDIGFFLHEILDLLRHHNITPPLDFVLLVKTFIMVDGLGLRYDPHYKVLTATAPIIKKIIAYEKSPRVIASRVREQTLSYQRLLGRAPGFVADTLARLREGRIDVGIVPQEFLDLRTEFEHGTGNMAIGMMVAALMVSSAIVMQVIREPLVLGIPWLSLAGFLLAGVLGWWLVRRTVFLKQIGVNNYEHN